MSHPQVVQSPIANDCLKVKIDGYTEPQLVPEFLLHVSGRELHKNIVRATKYGRLPLTDNKICCECQQDTASGQSAKIYTKKELVMMENKS